MEHQLLLSSFYSITALVFSLFVMFMYSEKEKYKNHENTVFLVILLFTAVVSVAEIFYAFCLSKYSIENVIVPFSIKVFMVLAIFWMESAFYYVYCQMSRKYDEDTRKKKRKNALIILGTLAIVSSIITSVLPLKYFDYSTHLYGFSGKPIYILFGQGILLIIFTGYGILFGNKELPIKDKIPLIIAIAFVIATLVIKYTIDGADYNTQAFQFALITISIYFSLENQDSKVLVELQKSKDEADKTNKSQTEFLTSMSHEVRTPMSTIIGFSDILLKEPELTKEVVLEDAKHINASANKLLDFIDDILDLSRISSNSESLNEADYDLLPFLMNLDHSVKPRINDKDISIVYNIDEYLPKKLYGDEDKLSKCLSDVFLFFINNLDSGAINFKMEPYKNGNMFMLHIVYNAYVGSNEEKQKEFEEDIESIENNDINGKIISIITSKRYMDMFGGELEIKLEDSMLTVNIYTPEKIVDSNPVGEVFSK